MPQFVAVVDFGSQYTQLIARRVRELGVYCEIVPHGVSPEQLAQRRPRALVLSGGPASVFAPQSPRLHPGVLEMGVPVLGICYGMQLCAQMLGGKVERGTSGEYGPAWIEVDERDEGDEAGALFAGLGSPLDVWMSHGDRVDVLPPGFRVLAHTTTCASAAMGDPARRIYGVQFHPEVVHTPRGMDVLRNFLFRISGCAADWSMADFIDRQVDAIRSRVGDNRVICALSGGVDSAVTAAMVQRAVGERMVAIFVDNGLLRAGEIDEIRDIFCSEYPLTVHVADARQEFLSALEGVTDPEVKRKRIGETFIAVFGREADRVGGAAFLAQGTLYPDVIESASPWGGPSASIKSHHNVGGLPEKLGFELVEPLRELFKDEVRRLGTQLGLPDRLLLRQPFPGPGLAVRVVGEVTAERLAVLRQADLRVQEEMHAYSGYGDIWQSFATLLPVRSVGVMGDERTYEYAVALRVVTSLDGMTADWARLPHELLGRISSRIINEVQGVNRVVYDISSKPPSTIEWE